MFKITKIFLLSNLLVAILLGSPRPKEWTLLFYVAADEKEIRGPTLNMIKQLEQSKALRADEVNIVVQYDDVGDDPNYRYQLSYVERPTPHLQIDSNPIPEAQVRRDDPDFDHYQELDSGNPVTLKRFLRWATKAYPARHYGLVLSGHSWGIAGVLQDFYKDNHRLEESTLIKHYELRRVMEELYREDSVTWGRKDIFDFLVVDACINGQFDVAYEYRDVFKYFVASTLEIPNNGVPFNELMEYFLPAVDAFVKAHPQDNSSHRTRLSDKLLEDRFLKPLVSRFVRSHTRGGSLVKKERQIDLATLFALRTEKLTLVAHSLKDFLSYFFSQRELELARLAWEKNLMKSILSLRDTDNNVDLLEFAKAYERYFSAKSAHEKSDVWLKARDKARSISESLGYHATDPSSMKTIVQDPQAYGAWAFIQVDEVANRGVAACIGLKSFTMLNRKAFSVSPTWLEKNKSVVDPSYDVDCNTLAKEHPNLEGGLKRISKPLRLDKFIGFTFQWPSHLPAYLIEEGEGKPTRRILAIWIGKQSGRRLNKEVFLRLAGTEKIDIDYIRGDPEGYIEKTPHRKDLFIRRESLSVPSYFVVEEPGLLRPKGSSADGLYVAEGHSNGTLLKHGLGILLDRKLKITGAFGMYNGGRMPIELVEELPYSMTLEQYMDRLGKNIDKLSVKEEKFFRLHRISETGWADFLFGPKEND